MKKLVIATVLSLVLSMPVLANETEGDYFYPSFDQTAYSTLYEGDNKVGVTIDLSDGWSVEFALGAVYLYNGRIEENSEAVAMGITLDKAVFDEYVAEASEKNEYREYARSIAYADGDGTHRYLYSLSPDVGFLIAVSPEVDGDDTASRFSIELLEQEISDETETE